MFIVFWGITPASAAVHVMAVCVRKCELASMHTNGQRVRCRLHAIVRAFLLPEAEKPFINKEFSSALTPLFTQCTIIYPLLIF